MRAAAVAARVGRVSSPLFSLSPSPPNADACAGPVSIALQWNQARRFFCNKRRDGTGCRSQVIDESVVSHVTAGFDVSKSKFSFINHNGSRNYLITRLCTTALNYKI